MQTIEQLRTGALAGAKHLKLASGLREFPPEIFDLRETLEVLDLSGNELTSLPAAFSQMRKLRILFCSDNRFTKLPEVLGDCLELDLVGFKANRIAHVSAAALPAKLRWLILTDNCVQALPPEIGERRQLQKLMLAGNALTSLPDTLANCERLELIRLSANRLDAFPASLLTLPRLSWLACSGNPFTAELEATAADAAAVSIPFADLELTDLLGQGASGMIYRAHHRPMGQPARAVAVKLFKGQMTSDGLPESEIAASLMAGDHPHVISVIGRLADHPFGQQGLVLQLVAPQFGNLSGPPSLDSCTRDIYPANTRFSVSTVLRLAASAASVAQHLHGRGIMHGDLYAHNVLHDGEGRLLLGDFGAASVYATDGTEMAERLQRIEVRAFGCLLEELMERCPDIEEAQPFQVLQKLKSQCLSADPLRRPSFAEINTRLAAVQ